MASGRSARRALAYVVAALVAGGPLATAAAAGSNGLSAPDQVFYEGCQNLPVTYSVPVDAGATGWEAQIRVSAHRDVVGQVDIDSATNPATGTVPVVICNDIGTSTGAYALTGDGLEYFPGKQTPITLVPGGVTLRAIPTSVHLQIVRSHHRASLRVTIRQATASGTAPLPHVFYRLQRRQAGHWVDVANPVHWVNSAGLSRVPARRVGARGRLRVLLPADRDHRRSVSNGVTLHPS